MAAAPMTGGVTRFRHAEEIIVDQQSEIDGINLWLSKKH